MNLVIFDPWHCRMVTWKQVLLPRVPVHLLLFILSVLQTQHKFFHFFPVLLLCHISRALGAGWGHQRAQSVSPRSTFQNHMGIQCNHCFQRSQHGLLAGTTCFTPFLSASRHQGVLSAGNLIHWDTAADLRKRNNDNLVRRFCSFVFCLCAFQKGKGLAFSDSALVNRKYTIRFLCSIWSSH